MTTDEYKAAADFWKTKEHSEMPREQLKSAVEEYICSSSVCALATGTGDFVRCTPLEYSFHDNKFWIFTEGGEKFIGLAENNNVSLAVLKKIQTSAASKAYRSWALPVSLSRCQRNTLLMRNIRGFLLRYSKTLQTRDILCTCFALNLSEWTCCFLISGSGDMIAGRC